MGSLRLILIYTALRTHILFIVCFAYYHNNLVNNCVFMLANNKPSRQAPTNKKQGCMKRHTILSRAFSGGDSRASLYFGVMRQKTF